MLGDFKVVSRPYVPIWRQKRAKRQIAAETVMGVASVAGLVLVWSPWRDPQELQTAISFQLAARDLVAVSLFVFMAFVLLSMAVRLKRAQRTASALLMGLEALALAYLAMSDPLSIDHLVTFVAVALASAGWLVVLALDLEDSWLGLASLGGVAALFLIPVSMGIGERVLITSCLVGMNVMFFRHFD